MGQIPEGLGDAIHGLQLTWSQQSAFPSLCCAKCGRTLGEWISIRVREKELRGFAKRVEFCAVGMNPCRISLQQTDDRRSQAVLKFDRHLPSLPNVIDERWTEACQAYSAPVSNTGIHDAG
jgi:hypothetical protein